MIPAILGITCHLTPNFLNRPAIGIVGLEDLAIAIVNSLDFLNFITALHKKTGVNVPESDYRKLLTLDGAVMYLAEKAK